MINDSSALEEIVLTALLAGRAERPAHPLSRETAILQLVDSLGLIIAMAHIQSRLTIALEPQELIEVFGCRTVAEVASTLQEALALRQTSLA